MKIVYKAEPFNYLKGTFFGKWTKKLFLILDFGESPIFC